MKRGLLGALAVLMVVGLVLAIAATDDDSDGRTYEIVFDNGFGLSKGGDFKVAGVRAGTTSDLRVSEGPRRRAIVTAKVTEPGFADLRRDAHCDIRPQSFIGEYFVDCQPGSSPERIPDGGRVPVEQTSSTIPLDLVNNIVRQPYADRLRIIIGELGAGPAGRPDDLSEVLRRAHPGLRETNQTLRVLARQTRTIQRVIREADTVVGALSRRRRDVARFVREAGNTAAVASTRRDSLAASFDRLPLFLAELDPYMLRLGQLATSQQPVLRNLRAAAGGLDTLLTRLPPFTEAGLPAVTSLGEASVVGRRAVNETTDDLQQLAGFAKAAPGLAKPLRQFLQSTDDRSRAVTNDPRAAATDPPAGDKTHIDGQGGFTGMEALWDYFFWQTLATNPLDDIGHVLRLNTSVSQCSGYFNHREGQEASFDPCRQWLGPNQPAINEPDPTVSTASAAPAAVSPGDPVLDYLLGP